MNSRLFIVAGLCVCACTSQPVLPGDELIRGYVDSFNSTDNELYTNEFPNAVAADFLEANIPVFNCPDSELEKTYYFRWWTFRKHIKQIPGGHIISEFLPTVPWAQAYNSIDCAASHHFREGRWLRDHTYLDDYAAFWFSGEGNPRQYSFPAADTYWNYYLVTRDRNIIYIYYKPLCDNFASWVESHRDSNGLFWQGDGYDGMEVSVGGSLNTYGYRTTINSYMYADAKALSKMAHLLGDEEASLLWEKEAEDIKALMDSVLWDTEDQFYKVMPMGTDSLSSCREEHGYVPWIYDIPDEDKCVAWAQLFDTLGFKAPFGPTTAERRHPGFKVAYEGHECQWNGPSWPFATSQTLTGMAACMQRFGEKYITKEQYLEQLRTYSSSHRMGDLCWIDENLNPFTGDWLSRTRLMSWENGSWSDEKGGIERGKDYNHSTFCDLVISGLLGVLPQDDGSLLVSPLIPEGEWDWFCLRKLHVAGHEVSIIYDKDGRHYNAGRGYRILVDGSVVFQSAKPEKHVIAAELMEKTCDVTFQSLLEEMADPAAHSKWCDPSYTCRQSSSYSRESVTPATAAEDGHFHPESGRDWGKGWFENHDFANFVREEVVDGKTEFVLHESEGPGCITRFWAAFMIESDAEGGEIKFYLDGNDEPVIDMDAKRLLGSNGLVAYPFSFYAPSKTENDTWHGNNLYLPIPYARGCKISYRPYPDGVDAYTTGLYYQINYRSYAPGTSVESFTGNTVERYAREIYDCGTRLLGPKAIQEDEVTAKPKTTLRPGRSASLKLTGEKCITSLTLKLKADDISEALGKTMLAISFDGEQTVLCPVGKFYGIGTRQLSNNTFYVNASPDGVMTAYWAMPFEKEARLSVINQSNEDVSLEMFRLTAADSEWDSEKSMYFHASWCENLNIDASDRSDYNYVRIKGKGRYVADGLAVYNHHPGFQGDSWWGEGDEKIFVDGEDFPSHFGTGTEDYYSYAYCRPQSFSHPPISQPSGEGNKKPGLTQNNRYRLLDDIPFEKSLDFYMEIWHAYDTPVDYSPASFWYAFKGCSWSHENNY